jgi:3-phenylpropionate/trans-cinnamate dioxygenase ferredoxin reductase subunit
MLEEVVLSRGFGVEAGRWFHERLAQRGVEILGGEALAAVVGEERVRAVRTESGRELECDCVVIGAGVRPDTMLAQRAGLEVDDGVVCDATLATSAPGIFAAGDCCSYDSEIHGRRLRVEHWDVALQQGRHAAAGMLGEASAFRAVPYFFSELADWASMEYVGPAASWDEVVWRGEREGSEWSAWYLEGGRVAACLAVGRSEDLAYARGLIESSADVSAAIELIRDPAADLGALA